MKKISNYKLNEASNQGFQLLKDDSRPISRKYSDAARKNTCFLNRVFPRYKKGIACISFAMSTKNKKCWQGGYRKAFYRVGNIY